METTRCLRKEHRLILSVLDCFEVALDEAAGSVCVSQDVMEPFVTFFRGFADKCHHGKEEDRLFPALEKKGLPREGGPIGVMIQEHEQARLHVRTMTEHLAAADGGDSNAANLILEHGRQFIRLMHAHIDKEDHCLFGLADQLIQGDDLTELTVSYRDAEADPVYAETFAHCHAIADQLLEKYGVAKR